MRSLLSTNRKRQRKGRSKKELHLAEVGIEGGEEGRGWVSV